MTNMIKQSIDITPLKCVGRKVDSVSFSGGSVPENGETVSEGAFSLSNSIVGQGEGEDGTTHKQLAMTLKLEPRDKADGYYGMELSVSGLYSAKDVADEDQFNALVLSVGASDLYAYAKRIAETLPSGGVRGDLNLPILTFGLDGGSSAL